MDLTYPMLVSLVTDSYLILSFVLYLKSQSFPHLCSPVNHKYLPLVSATVKHRWDGMGGLF